MERYSLGIDKLNEEANSFEQIYDRHIDCIFRLCAVMLANRQDAEDACQWVFMQLLKSGKRFRGVEHEKAWLIVVAKNRCINLLKSWWRKKRNDIGEVPEGSYDFEPVLEGAASKLAMLPEKYRTALYLRYCEDYSCEKAAELLRIKPSTVRSRCSRGLMLLRTIMEGDDND